ncbi:DUF6171 family protein [Sporosarcina sp. resist]|uniref:DUF6171 family protein n=1 Tax=Sporosarcina sp. resist TaxID=2762563 RepID=UPI001C9B8215|nr:DUF6171 family protein [Sporosarcina sp. resist]
MREVACKGCSQSVIVSDDKIKQLVKEQLQYEIDIVEDELYNNRLKICKTCPSLVYDTTCGYCGCFVQFRAKLMYKHCPHPDGPKW